MDKASAPQKLQRACTMYSLSTTASSCSSGDCTPTGSEDLCPVHLQRSKTMPNTTLPDIEYPTDLIVRNTFLEFPLVRSDSLDGFVRDRQCRSAPGSRLDDFEESSTISHPALAEPSRPAVLQLANLLNAEPEVGSQNCPTEGSKGHWRGECRPCAFFWKRAGCTTGASCEFCHLCDSGEKKRRQKEKQRQLKDAARAEREAAGGFRQAMAMSLSKFSF